MSKKGMMAKDTIIYMIAKGIEGIVGIFTISLMSYLYLPEDIGIYSTINIAITTTAMVLIQWLVQSSLRYINKYDLNGGLDKFYSTVFFCWLKINIITFFISSIIVLILSFGFFSEISKNYPISLIITAIAMFFTYNTAQLVIGLLAGARKSKVNLFLSIINVVGKLILILIFNKIFRIRVQWIFLSYIILDFVVIVIGVIKLDIFKYIKLKYYDKEVFLLLKTYGVPLMGNMLATSVLNKSDIYIITYFLGEANAGIYQTNYSIIASAFTLLSAGAMRGSYPTIVRTFSEGNKEEAGELIRHAIRVYLLMAIPAVFGIFLLSDFISISLFNKMYVSGHNIMGFVALGMMFLGLTEYAIKPWELGAKTMEIFKRSMICGVISITLNIIFIKTFGYIFGAISTAIAFTTYFILAKEGTKKEMPFTINKKSLFNIIISASIMSIVIFIVKSYLKANLLTLLGLIIIGLIVYFTTLYLLGEIKEEVSSIKKMVKKS